jgi:hypothetical protein
MEEYIIEQEFELTFYYRESVYNADVALLNFKGEKKFQVKYESLEGNGIINDLTYNPYLSFWHSDLALDKDFIDEIGRAITEEYLLMALYKK